MSQAEALYQLQEIDRDILRSDQRLQAIAAILQNNEAVLQAQAHTDSAAQTLSRLQAQMRDQELTIQANVQKTETNEQRLYSGSVRNPKELQDLQQEVQALKNWRAELEDRLLELMVAVEEAEAEWESQQTSLNTITTSQENEHHNLLEEQEQLQEVITNRQKERVGAVAKVTPENIKLYDNLRGKKANQPVAVLQGGTCGVCGIKQTTAIEQEVRRGQKLVYCTNCGRILAQTE